MKLTIISDNGRHAKKIKLNWWATALFMLSIFAFALLMLTTSGLLKKRNVSDNEIKVINKLDSMLMRTANLEAQVKRLNALGKTLASNKNTNIQDFSLSKNPALGGSVVGSSLASQVISKESLNKSIEDLEIELDLLEQKYQSMKSKQAMPVSLSRYSRKAKIDYSMPVSSGYISSAFGQRRDPINGHRRHHNGLDIAAKQGSKIHTIASGFVTFAGRKGGYGNIVEINHKATLKSRYAHLHKIKVKKGQVVRKGDVIATMGSTGRATGPHLHLEVWEKNRPVNPEKYIDTALIK